MTPTPGRMRAGAIDEMVLRIQGNLGTRRRMTPKDLAPCGSPALLPPSQRNELGVPKAPVQADVRLDKQRCGHNIEWPASAA
jgi:hypothetical protein